MSESLPDATQLGGTPNSTRRAPTPAAARRPRPRPAGVGDDQGHRRPGRGQRLVRRSHHHQVRWSDRGQRRVVHHPAEVDRVVDRPERGRQDDVLQRAHRSVSGHRGHRVPERQGRHADQAAHPGVDGPGPDLPEHPVVQPDDGRGERHGGDAPAPQGRGHLHHPPAARPAPGGAGGPRHRPRAARVRRHPATPRANWPATSPTATSAGWRSPGPWRCGPRCCCSTSRPPA